MNRWSTDSARLDALLEEPILIKRAAQGDQEAFAVLFHHYYAVIHSFAYRLCFDRADAEDIAQETFIRVGHSLPNFAAVEKLNGFRSWLYRIALNVTRDSLRRRQRRTALAGEMTIRLTREERGRTGRSDEIEEALAALPDDQLRALVLVFYEGLSHAQAAASLGCMEATVSWRIFRAKCHLRKRLAPPVTPLRP